MSSSPEKQKAEVIIDLTGPSMPGTPEDSEDDTVTDLDESPANATPGEEATLPPWGDYKAIQKRLRVLKRLQVRGLRVQNTLNNIGRDIKEMTKQCNKMRKRHALQRSLNRSNVTSYAPRDDTVPDSTSEMI